MRLTALPFFFFFFNDTATTEIYTLSLHDALPIAIPGLKPVFEVGIGTVRPRFVVFELMKRLPEGELGFDEVKDRIRDGLGQQLAIKHHLDLLRRTTYVDVRF